MGRINVAADEARFEMKNFTRCNYARCKSKAAHYYYRIHGDSRTMFARYCDFHFALIKNFFRTSKEVDGGWVHHAVPRKCLNTPNG
jgi:hypothetical protein